MVTWLLTVTGKDQPELLKKFAHNIALMEGIFIDSQQSVMGGEVVALLKVCLPDTYVPFAHKMFSDFGSQGLNVVSVKELYSEGNEEGEYLILELRGPFRFGIDHDIRAILESHGASVELLNQHHVGFPHRGEQQFSLRIRASLTRPISRPSLLQALNRLTPELNIKMNFEQKEQVLAS
ncbi:MAG: ACT domain-containing protein [Amphritea sp.]